MMCTVLVTNMSEKKVRRPRCFFPSTHQSAACRLYYWLQVLFLLAALIFAAQFLIRLSSASCSTRCEGRVLGVAIRALNNIIMIYYVQGLCGLRGPYWNIWMRTTIPS